MLDKFGGIKLFVRGTEDGSKENSMSSCTHILKIRDRMKKKAAGKKRKKALARKGTTPTKAALFGDKPER